MFEKYNQKHQEFEDKHENLARDHERLREYTQSKEQELISTQIKLKKVVLEAEKDHQLRLSYDSNVKLLEGKISSLQTELESAKEQLEISKRDANRSAQLQIARQLTQQRD